MAEASSLVERVKVVLMVVGSLSVPIAFAVLVGMMKKMGPRFDGPGLRGEGGGVQGLVFQPDGCTSGASEGYKGIRLRQGRDGAQLHVHWDPGADGWRAELRWGGRALQLAQRECARLAAEVIGDHDRGRERRSGGEVAMDCRLPDGGRVHGTIGFHGCR